MRVQIILLDTALVPLAAEITDQRGAPGKERYVPDPDPDQDDAGSRLQWAWLADELRKPAELR